MAHTLAAYFVTVMNDKENKTLAFTDMLKKMLGQSNEAEVKRLQKIADQVLGKEDEYKALLVPSGFYSIMAGLFL